MTISHIGSRASGGNGGSGTMNAALPAGCAAGDLALISLHGAYPNTGSTGDYGGSTYLTQVGSGTAFYKYLTSGDISAGQITYTNCFGQSSSILVSVWRSSVGFSSNPTATGNGGPGGSSASTVYSASGVTAPTATRKAVHHISASYARNVTGYNTGVLTARISGALSVGYWDTAYLVADQAQTAGVMPQLSANVDFFSSSTWIWPTFFLTENNPPGAPTVTAPNGGENITTGSKTITWSAGSDPDGDPLTYDIDYSTNNGGSWTNIATGISGTSYAWNTSALPNGSSYLVRVRSRDPLGLTSGYDNSNAVFTVNNNVAPNPATWVSPASNSNLDRTAAQTLTFQFNDPNVGDVLTKFDYRYRLVGAPTWTNTGTVTGAVPSLTLAAGSVPAGTYEFQVLTYDGQGVAATGWSASLQEVFADPPTAPAITIPASGGVVSTATGTAAWTTGAQTDFQVQRVRDNAGVIDTATVYQDTGIVTSTTARDTPLNFETNNRYEWIRVRVRSGGLWSTWSSVRYQVSYTTPAPPAMTFAYSATNPDTIQINITNPTPSGTQPAVSKIELWRRARTDIDGNVVTGPDAYANRVANLNPVAGGVTPFIDYTPASGVQYEYQAVILGVNNTWSYSPWVS